MIVALFNHTEQGVYETKKEDRDNMVKGVGIDITELRSWRKSKIYKKVTSLSEQQWCENNPINFAIVWSIKEAVVKAIGTGFCSSIN